MMSNNQTYQTNQENFWASNFGNEYTKRNQDKTILTSNIALFSKILSKTNSIESVIEFGSNSGINLLAIQRLLPKIKLSAVEINAQAVKLLKKNRDIQVYQESILNFTPNDNKDFVLIKGVLIHINPNKLNKVYDLLYKTSSHYICIAEYYNPTPIQVNYRGYKKRLFKRDFAGEILNKYKTLKLVDYGFVYHRDNVFPQDDITWFLLEKYL